MEKTAEVCQSCGMPFTDDNNRGTEADGTSSPLYCQYCYTNGQFTEPDLTLDGMLDRAAAVLSELYGMEPAKAWAFVIVQIPRLKRWSDVVIPVCQSCGMSMTQPDEFGTEQNGEASKTYCSQCYQQGAFTEPDLTLKAMIQRWTPLVAEEYHIPEKQAEVAVSSSLSKLRRWRRSP